MAITTITITQNNKVGDSAVMPIHSPLAFIANVEYTGGAPDFIYVDILQGGLIVGTFKPIYHGDVDGNNRQFVFIANDVARGLMDDFEDVQQLNGSVIKLNNIIELFTIRFRDPDGVASNVELAVEFTHGAAQFGSTPNFDGIYNNDSEVIYCPKGSFCYVYFYNNDSTKVITVTES